MERLLDVKEIAALLGVQPSTVYQWTHEGFIPFIKLGKFVRFEEGAIMKWLEGKSITGRKKRNPSLKDLNLDRDARRRYRSAG